MTRTSGGLEQVGDFGLESVDTYLEITWDDSLVGTAGFEPATPESRTQCSTRLSHVPTRFK